MLRSCFISNNAVAANPFATSSIIRPHIITHETITSLSASSTSTHLLLPTFLTSVKVFDGSAITNTVVRSDAYWSNITSALPYLILAQLLAALTFVVIVSFATAQGKFLFDQVAEDVRVANKSKSKNNSTNRFRKANEPPAPPLDIAKLFLCILIDMLGSANEAIPIVGEVVDVVYAPIAALLLRQLFSGSNVVLLLEFLEEILPFTDILPLATICWVVESFFADGRLAQTLRIGEFANGSPPVDTVAESTSRDYANVERKGNGDIVDAEIERTMLQLKSKEKDGDK